MVTNSKIPTPNPPTDASFLPLRELTTVLVKHYGLHEGVFDLIMEFQIGTGPMGPDPANLIPGAMIGVSRVGIIPTLKTGGSTVDASLVNPAKKPKK